MPNGKLDLQAKFRPNRPASECEQIHAQNGKKAKVSSFMGFNLKTPHIEWRVHVQLHFSLTSSVWTLTQYGVKGALPAKIFC